MNWCEEGRLDRFRYMRVRWPGMTEAEAIGNITSATVTESSLTTLKAGGTLGYAGSFDVGEDLVRIYSDSTLHGETETVCHGTFFATTPQSSWTGTTRSGKADMYSTLWILQQDRVTETYTAEAGANAVSLAKELAEKEGALTVIATPSGKCVNTSHTWDAGTSYLEIVNWLLDFAGYSSANVDAYGNVLMAPYVEPASKAPVVTFSDTVDSVSEPSFAHELDTFEIPNKVTIICSNADNEPMVAHAVNDDPENPYSISARGKTVARVETVTDASDMEALQRKANELLLSGMSVVESIEIGHSFQPFRVGDAIQLDYAKAGFKKKLVAVSREKQMIPGIRCKTKARRFANLLLEG